MKSDPERLGMVIISAVHFNILTARVKTSKAEILFEDGAFKSVCTRAILDAFWSHSSRTVEGHVREVRFIWRHTDMLGITNPFPRLGPFPRYHYLEMLQVMMVIMRSMES